MRDVGIVMPVYIQKESYLRLAIRSILTQRYTQFSFIIVIDGLLPNIERIIQQEVLNDPRVTILKLEQNGGVANALNRGFAFLMSDPDIRYLTWVSSDNVYFPKFLKNLRRRFSRVPASVGLVYSSFEHIDNQGNSIYSPAFNQEFVMYQSKPKEELLDVCFIGVSFMYKTEFAKLAGVYSLEPVEDYEYWLRLTEFCDINYVSEILMAYRVDSDFSISKELKTSIDQHRRWRYAFQLAKHLARIRRGIPFETTVFVPVWDDSDNTVKQVEILYEQYYSNFMIAILDFTQLGTAKEKLQHISDPRTVFLPVPMWNKRDAILHVIESCETPFAFVYDIMQPLNEMELLYLTSGLHSTESHVIAVYKDADQSMNYQTNPDLHDPILMRLYRTLALRERI